MSAPSKILITTIALILMCGILGLVFHQIFAASTPGLDLYVFWSAGRAILFDHRSPYSPDVTREIQLGIYGRVLPPGEDPMHFAYPPFALIPLLPLLPLPFDWVQAFWLAGNILSFTLAIMIAIRRPPVWLLLFSIFFYPTAFGLIMGNFAILIACILIVCAGRLILTQTRPTVNEQVLLGILLAWTIAKPQFSWFFILFFVIQAFRSKNFAFLGGLSAGMVFLLACSFIAIPQWPLQWLLQLRRYAAGDPANPPLEDYLAFLPNQIQIPFIIFCGGLILTVTAVLFWLWHRKKLHVLPLLAWGGAATFLLSPNGRAYEQIPFMIPFLIWIGLRNVPERLSSLISLFYILVSWGLVLVSTIAHNNAADRWLFPLFIPWIVYLFFRFSPPSGPKPGGIQNINPTMNEL